MIFAAGLGTRLRPLTDTRPKALVEVGGKPLLGILTDKLLHSGITDITVNVHHFPDQIVSYLKEAGIAAHISGERKGMWRAAPNPCTAGGQKGKGMKQA